MLMHLPHFSASSNASQEFTPETRPVGIASYYVTYVHAHHAHSTVECTCRGSTGQSQTFPRTAVTLTAGSEQHAWQYAEPIVHHTSLPFRQIMNLIQMQFQRHIECARICPLYCMAHVKGHFLSGLQTGVSSGKAADRNLYSACLPW